MADNKQTRRSVASMYVVVGLIVAFTILWVGAFAVMVVRMRAKEHTYLRRFPPVEGVPLDRFARGAPWSVVAAAFRAGWGRQADPELERQRRDLWRYSRFAILSLYVPLLVLAAVGVWLLTHYGQ